MSDLRGVVFEKTKITKIWVKYSPQKAVDRAIKKEQTLGEHADTNKRRLSLS